MTYTITLSEQEILTGSLHPNTLQMAKHFFSVHGFLKIENLFAREFLEQVAKAYEEQLDFAQEEMTLKQGTQNSHRRYIVPINFQKPFNDPKLYANALLLPLLKELLGRHLILSSFGAISALPGSTDQHLHADYFPLFEENLPLSCQTPPFAITVAIPLLDIDLINGPTIAWSGSHLTYPIESKMQAYQRQFLYGSMGCCYFWDYRTFHAGGSNHSENIRSLLYMAYTRRWFKDFSNPDFLHINEKDYLSIPQEHRSLFAHIKSIYQENCVL